MPLYPYQQQVKDALLTGDSVILQAPTGAGKTRAALAPFIEAFFDLPDDAFPRQCLYSVPMRVLATQFFTEYRDLAASYERRYRRPMDVRIQTGEFPEDPRLEGDLIFATLDQTLSSLLGVPYSLSQRQANLNVGAVLGSYLVFDEFHLFPHQATQATLQLLRTVGQIAPFILMTATFSKTMLEQIGGLLKAQVIVVSEEEVAQIETRQGREPRKYRRYQVTEHPLEANSVLEVHDRCTLAVCNVVDRAVGLYDALVKSGCRPVPFASLISEEEYHALRTASNPEERQKRLTDLVTRLCDHLYGGSDTPWVMLLHSRFERPHRQVKEALLQTLWGPEGLKWSDLPSLAVVATQVVEVGVDISAQTLHTELAPAASVLQRAGRCARYPGEAGEVFIYQVPENKRGEPNYAPYGFSKTERATCERSWAVFHERKGEVLHFEREQEVINAAHTPADEELLRGTREAAYRIWGRIADALTQGDPSTRRDLIRDTVSSRTVVVYDAPPISQPTEDNPYRYEGFSLHIGTLHSKLEALLDVGERLSLEWALRAVESQEDERDPNVPPAYYWRDIESEDDLSGALLLAVNPCLASYDAERGFILGEPSDGTYQSKESFKRRQRPDYSGYRLECYHEHIANMRRVFEGGPWQRRFVWPARRLAAVLDIPEKLVWRALRLAFALHDVGKLENRWQKWAVAYQEAIGEPVGKGHCLIAHTHYEPGDPSHEAAQKRVRPCKPKTHAGESADAGAKMIYQALEGKRFPQLYKAAYTAIARHHSPMLSEANPYALHPRAPQAAAKALAAAGDETWAAWSQWLRAKNEDEPDMRKRLLGAPEGVGYPCWWLYFLLVRNLRLCDGLSQETGS
jgi:CRISPR-associated endonuclease/helicase Cas3